MVPQPLPYQGSKRKLAPQILAWLPRSIPVFYEAFAGSAALTLALAHQNRADRIVLGDCLPALCQLWTQILENPDTLARDYTALWSGTTPEASLAHYQSVRSAFNQDGTPAKFLYLAARCVKNAVRFNQDGEFNQSPDRRRRGTRPEVMATRIRAAHQLLAGKTEVFCGDYAELLARATPEDVVYLDPPYMGVSATRDPRYYRGLDQNRFVEQLRLAVQRGLSVAISFDGRLGDKRYGPELPKELGLTRLELAAGRSSQATLSGRNEQSVESLYLSGALVRRL